MTDTVPQKSTGNKTLPDQWVSVELPTLIEKVSVSSKKLKQKDYESNGTYPVIDQGQEFIAGYSDATHLVTEPHSPVVVFGDHTRTVKYVDFPFIAGADGIKVMRPVGLDPRFFYYLMRWLPLPDKGYARHFQYVEKSTVPLPPLNEQRRIVEKIEELFIKLDASVRTLVQVRSLLKSYRRSLLRAAVEGELSREWREDHQDELEPASNLMERILQERREKFLGKKYKEPAPIDISELPDLPRGWGWASLDALCPIFVDCVHRTPKYSDEGYPALRPRDVVDGYLAFERAAKVPQEEYDKQNLRRSPQEGDVIYSRELSYGWAALVPGTPRLCLSQGMVLFRPAQNYLSSFLAYFLNSPTGRSQATKVAVGSAHPHINLVDIRSYPVPILPYQEQRFIVEEVGRRLSVVDKLEETVEENLKRAGSLRQSILKRAFSGHLVPQDPHDEPASVLLKRIGEERRAFKPGPRKKRGGATVNVPVAGQTPQLFI